MPQLIKAQEAVEKIDRNQLVMLRTMPSPPAVVSMVFEAVCILFGQTKTDWATAKLLLIDLNRFIQSLINYDKDSLTGEKYKRLSKCLANPAFDIVEISRKVGYAADIANFCKAMKVYADVNEKVKPKKLLLNGLQIELNLANAKLDKKLQELNLVKENVMAI